MKNQGSTTPPKLSNSTAMASQASQTTAQNGNEGTLPNSFYLKAKRKKLLISFPAKHRSNIFNKIEHTRKKNHSP